MRDYKAMISHALKKLPNNKVSAEPYLRLVSNE